jgi:hypothetical protein
VDPLEGFSNARDAVLDRVGFTRITGLETRAPATRSIIAISAAIHPSASSTGRDPSGSLAARRQLVPGIIFDEPTPICRSKGLLEVRTELKHRARARISDSHMTGVFDGRQIAQEAMLVSEGSVKSTRTRL